MAHDHQNLLARCKPYLLKNLITSPVLLAVLSSKSILSDDDVEKIESYPTRLKRVWTLLSILPATRRGVFTVFLDALEQDGQEFIKGHLLAQLHSGAVAETCTLRRSLQRRCGLESAAALSVQKHLLRTSVSPNQSRPVSVVVSSVPFPGASREVSSCRTSHESLPLQEQNLNWKGTPFPSQREYYKCQLNQSPIYEYVTRSNFYSIEDVFTKLQLIDNKYDNVVAGKDTKPTHTNSTSVHDIFKENGEGFLSVIIEGKPGDGKTTLLKHCAITWAKGKDKTPRQVVNTPQESPLLQKDLVIFIDKSHEANSLDETIRNAVKGPEREKTKVVEFMKNNPKKTFLLIDGLDEFLTKVIREEVFKLAGDCSHNMLVSCRLGHPYLENQMGKFNRHFKVAGFDTEDAQRFVTSFMKALNIEELDNNAPRDEKTNRLCEFVAMESALKSYMSPINCAFICILYNAGEVTDEELSSMTVREMYMRQQNLLLKRECLKRSTSQESAEKLKEFAQPTIRGIHKMALHSLLNGKQSSYNVDEASTFGIDEHSPAIVLLHSTFEVSADGPRKVFNWPHKIIKEFHAANAAQDQTIMYIIASKPEMNEVTKFLISSLVIMNQDAAQELLTAVLFLQSQDPWCIDSRRTKLSYLFSAKEHPCSRIPELRHLLKGKHLNQLLWGSVGSVNSDIKGLLRVAEAQGCLCGTSWLVQNMTVKGILEKLVYCVSDCSSEEKRAELLRNVVHPFLPSRQPRCSERDLQMQLIPVNASIPWLLFCMKHGQFALDVEDRTDFGRCISIWHPTIGGILSGLNSEYLKRCARQYRGVDGVMITTWRFKTIGICFDKAAYHDGESRHWKHTIAAAHALFNPKKGVTYQPSTYLVLADSDKRELEQLGVRLIPRNSNRLSWFC